MMSFFRLIMFRTELPLLMYLVQLERDHGFSNLYIFGSYRYRDVLTRLWGLGFGNGESAGDIF